MIQIAQPLGALARLDDDGDLDEHGATDIRRRSAASMASMKGRRSGWRRRMAMRAAMSMTISVRAVVALRP
jgi:hypothetical protein